MLMGRPAGRSFQVVDSFSRVVRLGEGVAATGCLSEAAIERTVAALTVCAGKVRARRARRVRAIATEACRRAGNCFALLDRVKVETGLVLEPVSSAEEARLTLAGCAPLFDRRCARVLAFDIGGGSTELMWVDLSAGRTPRRLGLVSLPVGVVILTERFGGDVSAEDFGAIVRELDADLEAFDRTHGIAAEIAAGRVQMLGTSGTMTTLAGVSLDLPRYDRARIDGLDMDFASIEAIGARMMTMSRGERAAHPCIGDERADLTVAGFAILEAICRRWPAGRLRVADRGIREGMILDMMAADAAIAAGARR